MDHTRLLNEIRSRNNLNRAFEYALYDRIQKDYFADFFELEYVRGHKSQILDELEEELANPTEYHQRPAYAFFPPKTDLCLRRMVYLNFKDLVIRYAFAIVFAQVLDDSLAPTCFANRRATGEQAEQSLLANFAEESWPAFCSWQCEQAQSNTVLLRTDITSFYDSISHSSLVRIFADELSVPVNSPVMKLFQKVLAVPVLAYSNQTGAVLDPVEMQQGLPIGNNTEGFFANIYLQAVDASMSLLPDVQFGRYVDDIRIFGEDRNTVLEALRVLQELLLAKGLNLNSAKTQLAEGRAEIEKLRSQDTDVYHYFPEIDEQWWDRKIDPEAASEIANNIDRPFEQFDRDFGPDDELADNTDAKEFCKFLSKQSRDGGADLSERSPWQVQRLETVLRKWDGSSRHAAWLLVQSAFYRGIDYRARVAARSMLLDILADRDINSYAKCRILHHLAKPRARGDRPFRFLDRLSKKELSHLYGILPDLLSVCAFELVIAALYTYKVLGSSEQELRDLINHHVPSPNAEPYKNVLYYVGAASAATASVVTASLATEDEPDEVIEPY